MEGQDDLLSRLVQLSATCQSGSWCQLYRNGGYWILGHPRFLPDSYGSNENTAHQSGVLPTLHIGHFLDNLRSDATTSREVAYACICAIPEVKGSHDIMHAQLRRS